MQAQKVGIREFRERLARFLALSHPIAVTRHGETVGFFIPTRPNRNASELEALRVAAAYLDRQIAAANVSEDELLRDFQEARHRPKVRA
ncbi:MAG TPA: type II toxin-antitoxin system Phd/YefM family antitoxin [Chloroflexota bacterium]|nr:type II toxin-antitoxin system Phd/YefM family antitoxin [Chloroflexota bacterium]